MRRKHVPLRTCIACQRQRPKRELIRIVRTPQGTTEIDPKGKRAGRGTYLCPNRRCWATAIERGSLGRALKGPPSADEIATLGAFMVSLPEDAPAETTERVAAEDHRKGE